MLATSGRRTRNDLRVSINALIDAQMRHEHSLHQQFQKLAEAQVHTDKQLKELTVFQERVAGQINELAASQKELAAAQKELVAAQKKLATSQQQTDERLRALIDIVERDRNGGS